MRGFNDLDTAPDCPPNETADRANHRPENLPRCLLPVLVGESMTDVCSARGRDNTVDLTESSIYD